MCCDLHGASGIALPVDDHASRAIEIHRLTIEDAPALAAYHQDNWRYMVPYEPTRPATYYDVDVIADRIDALNDPITNTHVEWKIVESGSISGTISLHNIVRGPFQSANIGYQVAHARHGRGIGTRAVALVLEHAFTTLNLHRVEAGTLVDNRASQRVLERNGFQRIGVSARYLRIAGIWQDHVLFAITSEDHC